MKDPTSGDSVSSQHVEPPVSTSLNNLLPSAFGSKMTPLENPPSYPMLADYQTWASSVVQEIFLDNTPPMRIWIHFS